MCLGTNQKRDMGKGVPDRQAWTCLVHWGAGDKPRGRELACRLGSLGKSLRSEFCFIGTGGLRQGTDLPNQSVRKVTPSQWRGQVGGGKMRANKPRWEAIK